VKVLPHRHTAAPAEKADMATGQTLGRGMDFALVVLVFLGLGYALDRWLGTRPLFMIGLVLFATIGQFIKMYFEYTAEMKEHEAQRAAGSAARRGQADAS
jgi:F0F1-type ATP synthase assembly protein I